MTSRRTYERGVTLTGQITKHTLHSTIGSLMQVGMTHPSTPGGPGTCCDVDVLAVHVLPPFFFGYFSCRYLLGYVSVVSSRRMTERSQPPGVGWRVDFMTPNGP